MFNHDVIILGGGFAGLTLALQLKLSKSDLSILVIEKRADKAPTAMHKVGESIVELGSYYLREVLQLKAYLTHHQLPKLGFRFFFSPEHKRHIERRVEMGSKIPNPIPAHQIDRGLFENELVKRLTGMGVEIVLGAKISKVDLSREGHTVYFEKNGKVVQKHGRWLVDSTGRSSLLKRKLGLGKELDHNVNAVWFRLGSDIDIDDWSEDMAWRNYLGPNMRRLATNHLMGEGYWVWIIPLVSGNTSIGIVADPAYHPFSRFNTFEKAMQWLKVHEPLAAKMLGKHKAEHLDFRVLKHFAHDTKQFYSDERWGLTGDAGAFLDPFYSPGADFIAFSNSWLTELISRDLNGENIALRTKIYEFAHRELLDGWILLYKNMYSLFGKTRIMLLKIVWDWSSYWGIPNIMFRNNGYTNIDLLKQYSATSNSIGRRFSKLNNQMQKLFLDWGSHDIDPCSDQTINVFDLDCLDQFHQELNNKYAPEDLMPKINSNLEKLEQIAAGIFQLVFALIQGTPDDMKIDPYTMSLDDPCKALIEKSKGPNAIAIPKSITSDLSNVWFYPVKTESTVYAR